MIHWVVTPCCLVREYQHVTVLLSREAPVQTYKTGELHLQVDNQMGGAWDNLRTWADNIKTDRRGFGMGPSDRIL
jgi:hypothetical protein